MILHVKKIPIGNPRVPPVVCCAKYIRYLIKDCADMGDTEDEVGISDSAIQGETKDEETDDECTYDAVL